MFLPDTIGPQLVQEKENCQTCSWSVHAHFTWSFLSFLITNELPDACLIWPWATLNFCPLLTPLLAQGSLIFGHSVPWAWGSITLQGSDLPCTHLGLTSILFPHGFPPGIFFFLFPQNISLQMSHFRMLFVFRKTHSSVLLNLEVKM